MQPLWQDFRAVIVVAYPAPLHQFIIDILPITKHEVHQ